MILPWTKVVLKWRVEDGSGKELSVAHPAYSEMRATPIDLALPFKSELSFDITRRGAAIGRDLAALIDLGDAYTFQIPADGKEYFLKGSMEIPRNVLNAPASISWYGTIEFPPVRIPLRGNSRDPVATGLKIEELGAKILDGDSRVSEDAMRQLSLIDDERVAPWYVKAMQTNSYTLKFAALDRLARFNTPQALEGLKIGMRTQGRDIGSTTTAEVAQSLADNIRHSTALALARSLHPEAKALLLTMANDPYDSVRLTVVQTASQISSPEAMAVMDRAAKDPSERVRTEALRLLGERR
jgi:hypothetical protein